MLYEFGVCFHTKVQKSNLSRFTDYKKRISGLSYSSTTDHLLDFYTHKKTEQHVHAETYQALLKHQALLTIRAKLKFAIRDRLWQIPRMRVVRGGKL